LKTPGITILLSSCLCDVEVFCAAIRDDFSR